MRQVLGVCLAVFVLTIGCGGSGTSGGERPWNRIEVTEISLPTGYTLVQGVSDDGQALLLWEKRSEIGLFVRGQLIQYPIEDAFFTNISPNGCYATAVSRKRIPGGDDYEMSIYLWEKQAGPRKILTRIGRGLGVRSLRNDGTFVAEFTYGSDGARASNTIFVTPPDQVVETPGPPPKPDIPIVAPPGYHDAEVRWYSLNERYAVGFALDSSERRYACIWNSEGQVAVLPPFEGADSYGESANYVSDDGTRALYVAQREDRSWIQALWIKGREPVFLTDLLKRAGEPEWDHPDWSFGARSANGRYFTLSRFDGKEYLVHVP